MPPSKAQQARTQAMVDRLRGGATNAEVCAEFGVTPSHLSQVRKKYGIPPSSGRNPGGGHHPPNPKRDALIITLHRQGVSLREMVRITGVSHTVINRVVATRPETQVRRIVPWTPEEDAILIDNPGASHLEMAGEIGRSREAVRTRRRDLRKRGLIP